VIGPDFDSERLEGDWPPAREGLNRVVLVGLVVARGQDGFILACGTGHGRRRKNIRHRVFPQGRDEIPKLGAWVLVEGDLVYPSVCGASIRASAINRPLPAPPPRRAGWRAIWGDR
jgi:hypothetical protein